MRSLRADLGASGLSARSDPPATRAVSSTQIFFLTSGWMLSNSMSRRPSCDSRLGVQPDGGDHLVGCNEEGLAAVVAPSRAPGSIAVTALANSARDFHCAWAVDRQPTRVGFDLRRERERSERTPVVGSTPSAAKAPRARVDGLDAPRRRRLALAAPLAAGSTIALRG